MAARDIYLKIELVEDYSPVEPYDKTAPPVQYRRDCMRNEGHGDGTIPEPEVKARALTAVVYREYEDPDYLIPKADKLVEADVNEPVFDRRVPGTLVYAYPGETLHIHVLNCADMPYSFHLHGLRYGIDSDGAWPFGTENSDGHRSDEICPNQSWTYTYEIDESMIGAWPFHDHAQHPSVAINRGLFGGIVVLPKKVKPPHPVDLPDIFKDARRRVLNAQKKSLRLELQDRVFVDDAVEFLKEWLLSRFTQPPPKRDVLHVPVFFHFMVSPEAKPVFDSGDIEENVGVFEYQFNAEGNFDYFCQYHPIMQGTVSVVAGGPNLVTVDISDAPAMGFYPAMITVGVGGTVRWENHSMFHHTVTSTEGAALSSHCINGRAFVGNSPTIEAYPGQRICWYVFNLDIGMNWHNFHPHAQRWRFAKENIDVRSMGPAESFMVETEAPPVVLLTKEMEKIQDRKYRPKDAKLYHLKGDYVFHCHVHHHLMNGMVGLVRSKQSVWLTKQMAKELAGTTGLPLDDGKNSCPDVDADRCKKQGSGKWEEIPGDPEVTFMHSMPLPNTEKVLYWGYTRQDQSRIWDYSVDPGVYATPANQPADLPGHTPGSSDLWSAEHTFLDDAPATLLAHGGLTDGPTKAFLFDPPTETWSETNETAHQRFYSTTLTLADGKAMTLFGSGSKSIEIYTPGVGWDAPINLPAAFNVHQYYPWTYLLPDGRLFIAGPHVPTHRFDWNNLAVFDSWPTIAGNRSTGGEKATSAMLTLQPPNYEPRIIIAGGNLPAAEKTAEIIDLSQPVPAWSSLPDLNVARTQQFTSVLMPDGRVFIAGGVSGGGDGGPCEIYDPENPGDGWVLGPTMQHARTYHSSIVMLLDGSILAGGDPRPGGVITPHERFYPWYSFVSRPSISNAAANIGYGEALAIDTPEAANIDQVILMRAGAVTHGYNMSQRAIECVITAAGAGTVTVQSPPDGNIAPPGPYMLFLLDGNRVPSPGRWIRLTP